MSFALARFRSLVHSVFRRPPHGSMQDTQNDDARGRERSIFALDAVNHDIRSANDDQFTRVGRAPLSSQMRVIGKAFDRLEYKSSKALRGGRASSVQPYKRVKEIGAGRFGPMDRRHA